MQAITTNWRQFKDEKSFQRFVDRQLSADQYKHLIQTDEAFRNRINGNPWDSTPNVRDAHSVKINPDSELAKMIQADEDERTRPERELEAQITDMVEKDLAAKNKKLRSRLDSGLGLDSQLCTWLDLPKNIPVMPIPTAGFSGAGLAAVKAASRTFMSKHENEGRFNEAEQLVLYKTLTDACGIPGRMFDPRSPVSWEAVYKTCLVAGLIRAQRTKPVEDRPALLVNLERALPTAEEKRKWYMTQPVFTSRKLGRTLTAYDIDQLLANDYKTIVREGYTADGKLLTHTDQLRPGRVN